MSKKILMYDALVIPGGRAPECIRLDQRVLEIVRHFDGAGKPVGGKRVTGYPACGPEVKQAGGSWSDIALGQALVDGSLVTAPAWPAHPTWLSKFLELLGTRVEHGVAATV